MASSKKFILCAGITLVIIMGVVPPWKAAMTKTSGFDGVDMAHAYVYRYGLIFTPPILSNSPQPWRIRRIGDKVKVIHDFHLDMPRLIIQWVLVTALTAGIFIIDPKIPSRKDKVVMLKKLY